MHSGRHTFGTVALRLKMRKEIVQKLLAHAILKQTDNYAKVSNYSLIDEMNIWRSRDEMAFDTSLHQADSIQQWQQFIQNFITLRHQAGFDTPEALAQQLGVAPARIADMKAMRAPVDFLLILDFCNVVGIGLENVIKTSPIQNR